MLFPAYRSVLPWMIFLVPAFLCPLTSIAAIMDVAPGSGTLQAAINASTSGDVLELRDGTYSGVSTVSNKNLTIRARAGSTPVLANNLTLSTADRLVLQSLQFAPGTRAIGSDAASELVLLQNTFNDARVTCNGLRCIAVGNLFNPQTAMSAVEDHNVFGGAGTVEVIFAGNQMLNTATFTAVTSTGSSIRSFFAFSAANVHLLGNHFRFGSSRVDLNPAVRLASGVSKVIGNRFEHFLDTPFVSDIYSPRVLRIENASVLVRNNAFSLASATAVQPGSTGYRISSLRAIEVAATGGAVRILNNVFDYRGVSFGAAASPTQGAILAHRFVQEIKGNVFVGIGHAAVDLTGGVTVGAAQNACYQLLGACPSGAGNVTTDPLLADPTQGDYRLLAGSPAINAGPDSPLLLDIDGTRNDIGAHGGPFDLEQFDVQRGPSSLPFIYPLFEANTSIDGSGHLQIRLIGVARNQH